MTTYIGAREAARLLGVTKPTLYAYVSRGMLDRRTAVDGRTSLYAREQVLQLAGRGRAKETTDRPSIDTQVTSSITELRDEGLRYRGHDVSELARTCSFEQVAELLWSGELPGNPVRWSVDRHTETRVLTAVAGTDVRQPLSRLIVAAAVLDDERPADDPITAGQTLLGVAPSLLGGDRRGSLAQRLASAWHRSPSPELVRAIDCALVLLADHELATSTLAVRVAASVRSSTYASVNAGLATVRGPYHGGASSAAAALLAEAEATDAATAVANRLATGARLPGFGHSVYRNEDPRLAPLLEAVVAIGAPAHRHAGVRAVQQVGVEILGRHANIDFGLGALIHVAQLPIDMPVFAVARIAGWVAHDAEERTERPVRYRGLARPPGTVGSWPTRNP
ncbi:MAG TPA: citrate/2-methylcitrate synthase [Ilumatobacter sp.]|nr:citrate/2-methylcitrate synthase [Ilumatobacter sp.]